MALAGSDPSQAELWSLDDASRVSVFAPPGAADAAAAGSAPRAGMLLALRAHVQSGVTYLLGGYEDGWCVVPLCGARSRACAAACGPGTAARPGSPS